MKFALTVVTAMTAFFASASAHGMSDHGHGPARMEARASYPKVITSCTKPKTVALTFDDGPIPHNGEKILKQLADYKAKATFFWNGDNYFCIYDKPQRDYIKKVYDAGHHVASHTWTHPHLPKLSYDKIHDELWKIEQAFERIIGVKPAFLRPPFGEYNDLVRRVAKERGQHVVTWDFDSGDSVGATVQESEKAYKNQTNPKWKIDSILTLNHEPEDGTVNEVLPYVLKLFKNLDFKLVTVAECLGLAPYQEVKKPGTYNATTWKC